jgi:hypothetical protein
MSEQRCDCCEGTTTPRAECKFRRGDEVIMSTHGLTQGLSIHYFVGRVVGFGRWPHLVRIKFPTAKHPITLSCKFFERPNVSARQYQMKKHRRLR